MDECELGSSSEDAESACLQQLCDILTQRPPGGRRRNDGPAEILSHLYLGSMVDALDVPLLRRLRITHVLNCAPSAVRSYANSLRVPAEDCPEHFSTGLQLQTAAEENNHQHHTMKAYRRTRSDCLVMNSSLCPVCGSNIKRRSDLDRAVFSRLAYYDGDRCTVCNYRPLTTDTSTAFPVENHVTHNRSSGPAKRVERPEIGYGESPYDAKQSGIRSYMELDIDDLPGYPILAMHYVKARRFFDGARESGGRALVHCELGVNRSATLAIAYLVESEQLPLTQAVRRVRIDRPNVLRNEGFRRQLVKFAAERHLLDRRYVNQTDRRGCHST